MATELTIEMLPIRQIALSRMVEAILAGRIVMQPTADEPPYFFRPALSDADQARLRELL